MIAERFVGVIAAFVLLVSACSASSSVREQVAAAAPSAEPTTQPEPTVEPATVVPATSVPATSVPATPTVAPTATPEPTPTAEPTATRVPTPTPEPTVVDTTPVIIDAGDWVITQGEIDEYMRFIELTHELEFTDAVRVTVSDDIGAEVAPNFEIFNEEHWYLLRALGLAGSQADRDSANQVRRDRIRGVCCQFEEGLQVAVEIEPTKLGTATIVVHELVHALHRQHPELYEGTSFETDEAPVPYAAAIEGVPQFVSFEFLAQAPLEERLEVTPNLPIIRDDMIPLLGPGPARYLNFAYAAGPAFVDAVVEANGLEGLSVLLNEPPTTTAQVLFPEKYMAGEVAVSVDEPVPPVGADVRTSGTIGAAMLMFVLTDNAGAVTARALVEPWAGDRFVMYEEGGEACMVANIALDDPSAHVEFGGLLVDSLSATFPAVGVEVAADYLTLRTCAIDA